MTRADEDRDPDDAIAETARWYLNRLCVAGLPADRAEFRDRGRGQAVIGGSAVQARPAWPSGASAGAAAKPMRAEIELPLSLDALLPVPAALRRMLGATPRGDGVRTDAARRDDASAEGATTQGSPAYRSGGDESLVAALVHWMGECWGTDGELPATTSLREVRGVLIYEFSSLGGTPEAWIEAVSHRFPDLRLTLEYLCPAICDAGQAIYAGGQLSERLVAPDVESVEAFARQRFGIELLGE